MSTGDSCKRRHGEMASGGDSDVSGEKTKCMRHMIQECEEELPGPSIGSGSPWRLSVDLDTTGDETECERRCRKLLEQALSCSELAEVHFVFDDGKSLLHGHWAMLCEVCEVFQQMKSIGMQEGKKDEVRIVGISRESFRGFLEWIYTGKAGAEMAKADGREIWLLAERYQVDAIKEWIIPDGLDDSGLKAAIQYALEGDGDRDYLLEVCRVRGMDCMKHKKDVDIVCGLCAAGLREILEEHARADPRSYVCAIARYRFFERWARVNEVAEYVHLDADSKREMDKLLEVVDPFHLPITFLRDVVLPSGLVSAESVHSVLEKRAARVEGRVGENGEYRFVKSYEIYGLEKISHIAFSKGWEGRRMAVAGRQRYVRVHDLETGTCVATMGSRAAESRYNYLRYTPQSTRHNYLYAMAFGQGEQLFVTSNSHNGSLCMFEGNMKEKIRLSGGLIGKAVIDGAGSIAVSHDGDLYVCYQDYHCIKVYKPNGTFLRKIGKPGRSKGEMLKPRLIALGADGRIVVVDEPGFGQHRVTVFDQLGNFILNIEPHAGCEHDKKYCHVTVGAGGEIVLSALKSGCLYVYSANGEHVRTITGADFGADESGENNRRVLAIDEQGRLYVADDGNSARNRGGYPYQHGSEDDDVVLLWVYEKCVDARV